MNKKKALIISNHSFYDHTPRSSQMKGVYDILIDLGYEVYICADEKKYKNVNIVKLQNNILLLIIGYVAKKLYIEKNSYYSILALYTTINNSSNYDICISIVNPFTNGLAAVLLKKAKKVKAVVVDSGDPYSQHRRHKGKKFKSLRKFIERYVSDHCDKFIIPISESIPDYPYYNSKYSCIEQIFPSKFTKTDITFDDKYINIVFAGRFYEAFRNPKKLLQVVSQIKKNHQLKVHLFLIDGLPIWLESILSNIDTKWKEWITIYDAVERSQLLTILSMADILINIENEGLKQKPSKLIDYDYSGSYVLNIGNTFPGNGMNSINSTDSINKAFIEILQKKLYKNKVKIKKNVNIVKYKDEIKKLNK